MVISLNKLFGTASMQIIGKGLTILVTISLANILTKEIYGEVAYIQSLVTILMLPLVSGMPTLLVREVAIYQSTESYDKVKEVINFSRCFSLAFSLVLITFLSIFWSMGKFPLEWLLLLPIIVLCRGVLSQQGAIFNGHNMPIYAQVPAMIIYPVLTLINIVFCYYFLEIKDTLDYLAVVSLASVLSVATSVWLYQKKLKKNCESKLRRSKIKHWLFMLVPLSLIGFTTVFNTEISILFLGNLSSDEDVAVFKVASQFTLAIAIGLSAVNTVIKPKIAKYYTEGDFDALSEILKKSAQVSMLVSLPVVFVLFVFGRPLINFIFGSHYSESYELLIVLIVGQLFNTFMGSVGTLLNMSLNEDKVLIILLFSLIVNIVLLYFLVPVFGAQGAAYSTTCSVVMWNILMTVTSYKNLKIKTWFRV